jgi:hypothetical protein
MDEISYGPISENGFDRIKVTFRIVADKEWTHTRAIVNAGLKQRVGGKEIPCVDDAGNPAFEPKMLDNDGKQVPLDGSIIPAYYVTAGVHRSANWTALLLPETIP